MALDLGSLELAVAALTRAVGWAGSSDFMEPLSEPQRELVRSGVIQHFEFTYELSWKFMRRWLSENLGRTQVDGVPRRELFRLAAEHRLIDNAQRWFVVHQARNLSSHTYNAEVAREVFEVAVAFVDEARGLLVALTQRNA